MRFLRACLSLLILAIGHSSFAQQSAPAAEGLPQVAGITELIKFTGAENQLIVRDPLRGGLFYYTASPQVADSGVIFPAQGKGNGCWIRVYTKAYGIDLSWFGVNGVADLQAIKRALPYHNININVPVKIEGSAVIDADAALHFTSTGYFILPAGGLLTINGKVYADIHDSVFTGNGRYILAQTSCKEVSINWFGAVADCPDYAHGRGHDNTTAIQNAINAARYVSTVVIPGNPHSFSYRHSAPVYVTKNQPEVITNVANKYDVNRFFNFTFKGEGTGIDGNQNKISILFADYTDKPGLIINASRRCYFKDFVTHGSNKQPWSVWNGYPTAPGFTWASPRMDSAKNYASPGVTKDHIGIAVDYETSNESKNSQDIDWDNVQVEGYYSGIVISAAGHNNGDRMNIYDAKVIDCVYGVVINSSQNRSCNFTNVTMYNMYCCYNNYRYGNSGNGQGSPMNGSLFNVYGGQLTESDVLFRLNPTFRGNSVISGVYAEDFAYIGSVGLDADSAQVPDFDVSKTTSNILFNSNNNAVIFEGCNFNPNDGGYFPGSTRGIYSTPCTFVSNGDVTFHGCNFYPSKSYMYMTTANKTSNYTAGKINIEGCSFTSTDPNFFVYFTGDVSCNRSTVLSNAMNAAPAKQNIYYDNIINLGDNPANRINTDIFTTGVTDSKTARFYTESSLTKSYTKSVIRKLSRKPFLYYDSDPWYTIISQSGDKMTFWVRTFTAWSSLFSNVLPDDIIISGGVPSMRVVQGTQFPAVVTKDRVNYYGSVTVQLLSDHYDMSSLELLGNQFFTLQPVSGDVQATSDEIRNVSNCNLLQPGDFFTFKQSNAPYRIKTINGNTLKLTNPVTGSFSGRTKLYNEELVDLAAINETGIADSQSVYTVLGADSVPGIPHAVTMNHRWISDYKNPYWNAGSIAGYAVSTATPANGQYLSYNGNDLAWTTAPYFNAIRASGDGKSTQIIIPHGLKGITASSVIQLTARSAAAANISWYDIDATSIKVYYNTPPPAGNNNLMYNYEIRP